MVNVCSEETRHAQSRVRVGQGSKVKGHLFRGTCVLTGDGDGMLGVKSCHVFYAVSEWMFCIRRRVWR